MVKDMHLVPAHRETEACQSSESEGSRLCHDHNHEAELWTPSALGSRHFCSLDSWALHSHLTVRKAHHSCSHVESCMLLYHLRHVIVLYMSLLVRHLHCSPLCPARVALVDLLCPRPVQSHNLSLDLVVNMDNLTEAPPELLFSAEGVVEEGMRSSTWSDYRGSFPSRNCGLNVFLSGHSPKIISA